MSIRVPLPPWLRSLYPYTPRCFPTPQGADLSYVDVGPGSEAVLMLHGNPTWSFYYRRLIQTLSPDLRCVAPDHVGMGLSAKPSNYPYTLASRIDDLVALVDHLHLTRVHLVVHDWGGAIGLGLAARRPRLIGRMVILNTAAFRSPRIPARIALCRAPGLGPVLVRGLNAFAAPATRMAMHRRRLTPEEKRGYLFPYDSWAHRVAVQAFVNDIPLNPRHPSWTSLSEVETSLARWAEHPALIVWGGRDFCFNDHFYEEWRRRLPRASTLYLPDAGHYVLEDAAEEALPSMQRFLLGG